MVLLNKEKHIINKLEKYKKEVNSNDKLEVLFDLQNTLDNYIKDKRGLDYSDKEYWVQQMCRCIITEACELNNATNWKYWKNHQEVDWKNVKEEIIDLWHFLISLSIKMEITPQDVVKTYIDKNLENYKRQWGTSERSGYQFTESEL